MRVAVLVILVAGMALVGAIVPWWKTQAAARRLAARDELSDDDIFARFFASSGLPRGPVLEAWHEIADTLKAPSGRLRPEDRFGKDIGVYWITSDALDVLAEKGRIRAKKLGRDVDLKALATVDEYVRAFARQ